MASSKTSPKDTSAKLISKKYEIVSRYDSKQILFTAEGCESLGEAVLAAIKAGADLSSADLSSANLRRANLRSADLSSANLSGADLSGADLRDVKDAVLSLAQTQIIPQSGAFEGFKKLKGGKVCRLLIPADALRVGGSCGRKCRASMAVVLEGEGTSKHDPSFKYEKGKTVKPTSAFCPSITKEYASGIHFFITREEAAAYSL